MKTEEILARIADAPVAIFATEELRIVAINRLAAPSFAQNPHVIGKEWPTFLDEYWTPDAAAEVNAIVHNTLTTGTPFSSMGFTATKAADGKEARYDWEVHRILTADSRRMLLCYFVGPE